MQWEVLAKWSICETAKCVVFKFFTVLSYCEENALKGPRIETKTVRGHLEKEEKCDINRRNVDFMPLCSIGLD